VIPARHQHYLVIVVILEAFGLNGSMLLFVRKWRTRLVEKDITGDRGV